VAEQHGAGRGVLHRTRREKKGKNNMVSRVAMVFNFEKKNITKVRVWGEKWAVLTNGKGTDKRGHACIFTLVHFGAFSNNGSFRHG